MPTPTDASAQATRSEIRRTAGRDRHGIGRAPSFVVDAAADDPRRAGRTEVHQPRPSTSDDTAAHPYLNRPSIADEDRCQGWGRGREGKEEDDPPKEEENLNRR